MGISSVSGTSANRPTASAIPEAVAETGDQGASDSSATAGAKATGVGGYISPFLRYDQGARVAVLLFRDVDTGETQDQIPSQRVVEEYRRTAGRLSQPTESGAAATGTGGAGRDGATSASGTGGAGASVVANRGISFASFGTSGSTAASPAASSTATPASGAGSAPPPPASAGGGAASPGGLVSVTV